MKPRLKKQSKGKSLKDEKSKDPNWDKELVVLSLKHIQHQKECFSDWDRKQLQKFWDFNKRLHKMTWTDVFATASKGANKRGMAYTVIPRNLYHGIDFIKNLSEDIKMFELRVDAEIRVHGFREKQFFHLCLLDRNHTVCSK